LFIFRSLNSSSWSEVYGGVGFQSSISKGTTTIIWNLHANPHDFSSSTPYEESRKVLSSNIAHLSVVCVWLSSIFYVGAYFSNFDSWLMSPAFTPQSSQVVSDVFGQGSLNNDFSYSAYGIRILSGVFNVWLSWGVVSSSQLKFLSVLSALAAGLFLGGGFLSMHLVVPIPSSLKLSPSLFLKSTILLSLGMISWSGHILHVSVPTLRFLSFGVSPDLIPSPI
jgi:photosystem I P700 chlorophyll a apoprotein A1